MSSATQYTKDAGMKVLTIGPVFDKVYPFCSPAALARIAKTCPGAYKAVDDYMSWAFNVNKLLSPRFFSEEEVIEFRNLQARLQFLISGSTALQLLDRTRYPGSDLDVYTFPNDAEPLGNWLISLGWTYRSIKDHDLTFHTALGLMQPLLEDEPTARREEREQYASHVIRELFHFFKTKVRDDGSTEELELQIIVADLCPMQAILAFHSTVVMNYIAWDHACAFYPLGTFEERRALVTYDKDRKFKATMMKYAGRGFRIDSTLFDSQITKGAFRFGRRFVGDGQCWTVKLNTTGIVPPPPPPLLERLDMTINGWELGYHTSRHKARDYGSCAIFRIRYDFFQYLHYSGFIRSQGKIEWSRFDSWMANVPPGVGTKYGQPKPPGFTYWDQNLVLFRDSFLASLAKADNDVAMDLCTD